MAEIKQTDEIMKTDADQTTAIPAVDQSAEQPTQEDKKAPLGATWQDRIKNATASEDDMRTAYEEYKAGKYTPGPKTLKYFQDNYEQQPAEQSTEQPTEQTVEQPTEQPQEEAPATAADGAPADPETQQQTEQIQAEIQEKSPEELKAYLSDIEKQLNTNSEEKAKMAGIFEAYKNGQIDKNQRDYFLADAIARFANNIAEIQDAKNQNALWANITSGNQKSANIDLSPNEWQQYLKTDWQASQKLKNEAKTKATMDKLQRDTDALSRTGQAKYLYNELPELVKDSKLQSLPDNERVGVYQMIATMNGSPLNADQLGNVYDAVGNAILGNKIGDKTLEAMGLSNNNQSLVNAAQTINNGFLSRKNELDLQLQQGQIDIQTYEKQMQDELIKGAKIDNFVAEQSKDTKVKQQLADLNNTKYGSMVFEISGKIPGFASLSGTVTGANLVNAGQDITDLISKGLVKIKGGL